MIEETKMKHSVLEKTIEAYLVHKVKAIGGVAEKFTSPNRRSVPDRIVWLPEEKVYEDEHGCQLSAPAHAGARVIFVELKAPGKKPTENQLRDHEKRRAMGFRVEVLDTKDAVDEFIRSVS